jgi:enoyl-CoA hydratase
MKYDTILYSTKQYAEGAVATITMNRPDRMNPMDVQLTEELNAALTEADEDDEVKVVIIKGAGRAFSTGYDLGKVYYVYGGGTGKKDDNASKPSQRARLKYDRWRSETLRRIFTFPKVTIAQVHGFCIGGGLYMSLCCDITIAAEDAKIGHPEARLGTGGAMYVLPIEIMLIGQKRARELLLTGKLIDGKEAERIGLVNHAVPADKLEEETNKMAQAITLMSRDGIRVGKAWTQMVYDIMGLSSSFTQGFISHTMFTGITFDPKEFNFLKERRDRGVREAAKLMNKRYEGLV